MPSLDMWLTVDAGACYRLTRLGASDRLTEPLRRRIIGDGETRWRRAAFDFATCPWCLSIWVAAGVVALTYTLPRYWWYVALVLALSAVAGIVSELVP